MTRDEAFDIAQRQANGTGRRWYIVKYKKTWPEGWLPVDGGNPALTEFDPPIVPIDPVQVGRAREQAPNKQKGRHR